MAAKLPDAIERTIPQPARSVVQLRPNLNQGVQVLADGMSDVSTVELRAAEYRRQTQANFELSKAETELTKSHISTLSSLEDDDFTKYGPRYDEKMAEARTNASKLITDPLARAKFEESADLMLARGSAQVADKAKSKEGDLGRASLIDDVDSLTNMGLGSTNQIDRISALTSIRNRIQTSREKGYIDAEAAARLSQKASVDYAVKSFELMPPAMRLTSLNENSGLVAFLPPDTKATLIERAKLEQQQNEAQAEKLRNDAIEKSMTDASNVLWEEKGVNGVTSIPLDQWNEYSPSQKSSLISFAKGMREGIKTDTTAYIPLVDMAARDPQKFIKATDAGKLAEMRPNIEDRDYQHLISLREGILKGDEGTKKLLEDTRTQADLVNGTLLSLDINPLTKDEDDIKKVNNFKYRLSQEISRKKESLGKDWLTTEETQDVINTLVMNVRIPGSKWFGLGDSTVPYGTMTIDNVPEEEATKIRDALSRRGKPTTDAAIIDLYVKKLRQ